jgi:hypothetical protein
MMAYIFWSSIDLLLINSDHNNVSDSYRKMNLIVIKAKSKDLLNSKNRNESKER